MGGMRDVGEACWLKWLNRISGLEGLVHWLSKKSPRMCRGSSIHFTQEGSL